MEAKHRGNGEEKGGTQKVQMDGSTDRTHRNARPRKRVDREATSVCV